MKLSAGTIHPLSQEIKEVLISGEVTDLWQDLTPLARNEWICWATSAKRKDTQVKRKYQMIDMLKEGKKRPCCWPGCPHHNKNTKKWL